MLLLAVLSFICIELGYASMVSQHTHYGPSVSDSRCCSPLRQNLRLPLESAENLDGSRARPLLSLSSTFCRPCGECERHIQ